jgi:hypothetical protein
MGWPIGSPVRASHRRADRSWLAVTTRVLSGLKQAATTGPSCWSGGVIGAPVSASHTRALPSLLAVTTRAPSELKRAVATAAP